VDPDSEPPYGALEGLAALGPHARPATPRVLALVEVERFRGVAVRTLGVIGDPRAVPALRRLLAAGSRDDRCWAAHALGRLGAAAAPAVDALTVRLAEDGDPLVRAEAARALGRVGPAARPALPALRAAADEAGVALVREHALAAIAAVDGE